MVVGVAVVVLVVVDVLVLVLVDVLVDVLVELLLVVVVVIGLHLRKSVVAVIPFNTNDVFIIQGVVNVSGHT